MTNRPIKRCPKRKSNLMTWGNIKTLIQQAETLGKQKHNSTDPQNGAVTFIDYIAC